MARIVDPEGREREVLHRLVTLQGKNVLDIGCGDGRTTRNLAQTAASVLGIDPDTERITLAREAGGERCTFRVEDTVTLDLASAGFDVVVFSRSL